MNHPEFSEGTAFILIEKDIREMFSKLKCPFTGKAGKYDQQAFKTMVAELNDS